MWGEGMSLHRGGEEDSPTTVVIAGDISLVLQCGNHLLQCGAVDACFLLQICLCGLVFYLHCPQNLTVGSSAEGYALAIVPPYILIAFGDEQYIVGHLFGYQLVHIFMERPYILQRSMGTIGRRSTYIRSALCNASR